VDILHAAQEQSGNFVEVTKMDGNSGPKPDSGMECDKSEKDERNV
jgi:hypothetical protein